MGTELRKLLENAKGTAEHIIAIVLDIRGFTPFCQTNESWDVANFIKRVYIRVIDDYFPRASFYKPTGDGLLIVLPYKEESRKDLMVTTTKNCLSLLRDFGKLCEGDDMINFSTPDKIGIGMSRGTACCITSGGTIVDYSGKVINLASRLNDFARPGGIVFDSSLGIALLPKKLQELFLPEKVYVRGIAEDKPITIYFTKQYTLIPSSRKQPLKEPEWSIKTFQKNFGTMKALSPDTRCYSMFLPDKPLDEKQISLVISYRDEDVAEVMKYFALNTASEGVKYIVIGSKQAVNIKMPELMKLLKDVRRDDTLIKFEVSYPVARKNN